MQATLMTLFAGVFTILALLFGVIYVYFKLTYKYFHKRGILFDKPIFPFGSMTSFLMMKKPLTFVLAELYDKYKKHKLVGYFTLFKKQILINDPEIIKSILVKDFDTFINRGMYFNKRKDPLSAHLFSIEDEEWKIIRSSLSPTFTSGKMKGMFPIVVDQGKEMNICITHKASGNKSVNLQNIFYRYGLAIISSTAFGLESDALANDDSLFVKMANLVLSPSFDRVFSTFLLFERKIAKMFDLKVIPPPVSDFCMRLVKDTVKYREDHQVTRIDYLQLLIQLKNNGAEDSQGMERKFTLEEIAAEALVFILAGSETSSTTAAFCLYEISLNPEMQDRLQQEVDGLQEITYEGVNDLEYLDMVVNETLRKYPPLGFLNRECSRDYQVPGTNTVIEKGTQVVISTHGLHHDPDLFPDPERFIPERFSKENKNNIRPYTYMPFGEGPRHCIGMRFARMMVKTGLAMILRSFRIVPSSSEPMTYEPRSVITNAVGGLWFKMVIRNSSNC